VLLMIIPEFVFSCVSTKSRLSEPAMEYSIGICVPPERACKAFKVGILG
jgi:hypothetical protein